MLRVPLICSSICPGNGSDSLISEAPPGSGLLQDFYHGPRNFLTDKREQTERKDSLFFPPLKSLLKCASAAHDYEIRPGTQPPTFDTRTVSSREMPLRLSRRTLSLIALRLPELAVLIMHIHSCIFVALHQAKWN